jgi:hypothetical protein
MRGAIIDGEIVCPRPSRMGICGLKVIEFPWTALTRLSLAPSFAEKATGKVAS